MPAARAPDSRAFIAVRADEEDLIHASALTARGQRAIVLANFLVRICLCDWKAHGCEPLRLLLLLL